MELFYTKYGNGNPLIIIHGLFGNSDNWMKFAKNISEQLPLSVYTIDLRNHGRSSHHPVFSMEALVDDLSEFLEKQNIEEPILMGHSLGAKIILNYLKEPFSQKIKAIIVADMGLRTYEMKYHHVELLNIMKNTPLDSFADRKELESYFSQNIPSPRLAQFVLKNLKRDANNQFLWKINLDSIDVYLEKLLDGVSYQKAIEIPSLFMKGENSDYINSEDKILINKYFKSPNMVEISNAGHWINADNPVEFEEKLISFLRTVF